MYSFISAYGIEKGLNARWGDATVAQVPMQTIFAKYRELKLKLSSPFIADPFFVDFEIFRADYSQAANSLEEIIEALDNTALETIPEPPRYDVKHVIYNDAYRAGYKVDTAAPGSHPSSMVYPDDRTEVVIVRENTNMQAVYDYCLLSINGFFHRTDTDGQKVFALNGGKSLLKSRQNQIGLYSFEDIGKIQTYAITPDRVYHPIDSTYAEKAWFDFADLDLTDKTVFAVIGGYLYLPWEDHFSEHSAGVYTIDFKRVPVLDRYFEALPYLDFSELQLQVKPASPALINKAEFFSDEHFSKYLTMSQSFFVVVDTPRMHSQRHYLKIQKTPGVYTTYSNPDMPLITGTGKVSEYWKSVFEGQHVLTCHDAAYYNRQANSIRQQDLISATGAEMPYRTFRHSSGYLLEMGADIPV